MIAVLLAFTTLFAVDNAEFIATSNQQLSEGYNWQKIECRAPNEDLPNIKITTPIGNDYVCWKLKK